MRHCNETIYGIYQILSSTASCLCKICKFVFQLDINTAREKLKIPPDNKQGNKSIDIEKISIGLKLSLV